MVNICILFVGGEVFSCGVVSSPGLQRETHSGGPLLPTSYRPHGPPILYLSHQHGPPIMWPLLVRMAFLLLFLWLHLCSQLPKEKTDGN